MSVLAPERFCSSENSSDSEVVPETPETLKKSRNASRQAKEENRFVEIRGKLEFGSRSDVSSDFSPVDAAMKHDFRELYPEIDDDEFTEMVQSAKKPKGKARKVHNVSSDSDDDAAFEAFLSLHRTPAANKSPPTKGSNMSSFLTNDDSPSSHDSSGSFYLRSLNDQRCWTEPILRNLGKKYEISEDEDNLWNPESDKENTPPQLLTFEPKKKRRPPRAKGRINTYSSSSSSASSSAAKTLPKTPEEPVASMEQTFLQSLSPDVPTWRRHVESEQYVGKAFKKNKDQLIKRLFEIYNEHIFEQKLPSDLPLVWNSRLTKTAGQCVYRRNSTTDRVARIELSEKVCDSAERVRDTLIHELCHAAVWIINGDSKGGHGLVWKQWANKAHKKYPELPVVTRCHNYEIKAKYVYKCNKCTQEVHRHSKSLDTERKRCGICFGRFELVSHKNNADAPPATPKFALFVKENYGSVKKDLAVKTHKEVMGLLSEKFKSQLQML